MQEININFTNNNISKSRILDNAIIGNNVVNTDVNNAEDINQLIEGLKAVKNTSADEKERRCAECALGFVQKNKMAAFWEFVKENLGTFVTGTFTDVVGGVFLEIVKAKFNL